MVDVDQVEKGRMVDVNHEKGRMVDVDQVEVVVDVDLCLFHGRRQAALFITPLVRGFWCHNRVFYSSHDCLHFTL